MNGRRLTGGLFLATLFCVTFEKVHWNFGGSVSLADLLTIAFLAAYATTTLGARLPRTTVAVLAFFTLFLLVYLVGFFNLDTHEALSQFVKGMVKFVVHFLFLAAAIALLVKRGREFYWRSLGWFVGGLAANAAYGVVQLLAARAGHNLDHLLLAPLTGGASSINIYGAVNGANVYRPNALTGDPNHLGVMLIVPLLVLAPIYLRLPRGHEWKRRLAWILAFLVLVELATLSRSGLLGLAVGLVVLALPYRSYVTTRAFLLPLAGVAVVLAAVVFERRHYFEVVLRSRLQAKGSSAHFAVYDLIPNVLHLHPLFGLGLNNFSVYYQFVTGKTNWGPHSFYVALLVETGLVGAIVFGVFLAWIFARLRAAHRITNVRPLVWGLTAALAGTMASNFFYLTMQFYYFYAFVALCLAVPLVFRRA